MPRSRELPDDLVARLGRVRELERLAETELQYQRAVHATTTLVTAAIKVGWRVNELAAPLGLSRSTLSKRVNDARRAGRVHETGLVVDAPLTARPPLVEFTVPVEDRQWLTRAEAARYAGVAPRTLHGWHERGLLPHTRVVGKRWRAYLRADLDLRISKR